MIDERRDTAVRVVLGVLGSLLLEFVKVEVDALVGEAKFGQDEGDLPVDESGVNEMVRMQTSAGVPAIRAALVGVEGELLAVRHTASWGESEMLRDRG